MRKIESQKIGNNSVHMSEIRNHEVYMQSLYRQNEPFIHVFISGTSHSFNASIQVASV